MRFSSFHIDGYGALADIGYEDLAPGLVVALGPNEAGKSTLFDFLAGVLFGFPARRNDPRYRPPSRGGRHGGRIGFVDDDDGKWAVERHTGPGKSLHVRTPEGLPGDDATLKRALAGASAGLFRAVFAVGLDELGGMDSLSDDEVRELLFTASLIGQRSSASMAMRHLSDQCQNLARPRRGDAVANRLAAELEVVRADLVSARRQAALYHSSQREAAELKEETHRLRTELREARERERELALLKRAAAVRSRMAGLERELATVPAPPADRTMTSRATEIRRLKEDQSGHHERVARLGGVTKEAARQGKVLVEGLAQLGEGWSEETLRSSVGPGVLADHVRTCRQDLILLSNQAASGEALLRHGEEALARAAEEAQAVAARSAGRPKLAKRAAIERDLDAVDELHDRFGELERLDMEATARQSQRGAESSAPATSSSSRIPVVCLVVAAMAVAGLGIAALVVAQQVMGVVAIVVAGALLAAAASLAKAYGAERARQRAAAPIATEGAGVTADAACGPVAERERQRVHELATQLGLPVPPSRVDIERCAAGLQRSLGERARLDESAEAVAQAARKAEAARDEHERCLRQIELKRQDFARWRAKHGLGAFTEPDEALEALALVTDLRQRLTEIDRLEAVRRSTEAEVGDFVAEVGEFYGLFVSEVSPTEQASGASPEAVRLANQQLDELVVLLEQSEECQTRRLQLESDLAACSASLHDLLGQGPTAERLTDELLTGSPSAWDTETDDVQEIVERLEAQSEQAVRQHQSVTELLEEVGDSDRIAVLEQRQAALEAELDATLRQFLVLGTARTLLQHTLAHHEKERQPAVIASAAEHFRRVTGGRYVNLLADADGEGGQSIRVVASSGAEIDAACLSRGTIEQLYLCLRLGLADSFAERAVGLPMVLDDVLVNFDPERAESMAAELACTARQRQVLLMTCHPEMAELVLRQAEESSAQSQLIELKRIA